MKNRILIIFLFLSLTVVANENVRKVAILETVDKVGDVPYGIKLQVRMSLTYAISNTPGYEGFDRVDMSSIMGEQNFQRTGMVSDAQIKKLGEMTGAQYVLIAEAALYDAQNIIITAKVLDVETGGVANSAPPAWAGKDPEKMQAACVTLAQKLLDVASDRRTNQEPTSQTAKENRQAVSYSVSGKNYIENEFDLNMKMIWVEGGEFTIGCTVEQGNDCKGDEKYTQDLTLDGYYIGMLEVTQSQWRKVMKTTFEQQVSSKVLGFNKKYIGDDYPMFFITWDEAMAFCEKLSKQSGRKYTLPTEAQWEFAARGGIKSEGKKYAGSDIAVSVAWCNESFSGSVHPCGTKLSNELGIYDMSGNVMEWCKDWYKGNYKNQELTNPQGPASGNKKVVRGGSSFSVAIYARVSSRYAANKDFISYIGFRVVCLP